MIHHEGRTRTMTEQAKRTWANTYYRVTTLYTAGVVTLVDFLEVTKVAGCG